MADLESDVIRATVRGFNRVLILWLTNQKPTSGYGITKELKRLTGQSFHSGVVYPLLYELEENGLIAGKWVQKRRRRTKYYSITKEGVKVLNRLRELFEMPVKEFLKDVVTQNS